VVFLATAHGRSRRFCKQSILPPRVHPYDAGAPCFVPYNVRNETNQYQSFLGFSGFCTVASTGCCGFWRRL
jgi:hypothetical protein